MKTRVNHKHYLMDYLSNLNTVYFVDYFTRTGDVIFPICSSLDNRVYLEGSCDWMVIEKEMDSYWWAAAQEAGPRLSFRREKSRYDSCCQKANTAKKNNKQT